MKEWRCFCRYCLWHMAKPSETPKAIRSLLTCKHFRHNRAWSWDFGRYSASSPRVAPPGGREWPGRKKRETGMRGNRGNLNNLGHEKGKKFDRTVTLSCEWHRKPFATFQNLRSFIVRGKNALFERVQTWRYGMCLLGRSSRWWCQNVNQVTRGHWHSFDFRLHLHLQLFLFLARHWSPPRLQTITEQQLAAAVSCG